MTGDPLPCDENDLRSLFLFEKLEPEQLARLCREGRVERFDPGPVYAEGEPAASLFVLVEGTVVLSRRVGSQDVDVTRSSARGVYAGAFQAYLGDQVPQVYNNSMRVTEPSRFFVLPADTFAQIMHDWFPMAVHLLEGLFFGAKNTQEAIGQRERLLALGSLAAGLTHELNNPAAAAVRAAAALRERVAGTYRGLGEIAADPRQLANLGALTELRAGAAERLAQPPELSPLQAADDEDAVVDWLEEHGITDAWQLAPVFVQSGLDTAWLDRIARALPADVLGPAVRWLNGTAETELLINEIEDATSRIADLVGAAKQYSQLDRAPHRRADVNGLLESTLVMLAQKIGPRIRVVKDYDRTLPRIPCYPAELNQVWTNLIDNAISALHHSDTDGTLTVRTARDGDRALVEIRDTGPGIPPDIRDRVFHPFFTTKPVGEGTGLGLDISWRIVVDRHHGDLSFQSVPGDTRFQVRLPLNPTEPEAAQDQ